MRRDVIRTLDARRLDGARDVQELGSGLVQGKVVARGQYDELGGSALMIVADAAGKEHLARLALGQASPAIGRSVTLTLTPRGAHISQPGRDLGQEL